jgi:hypothetical protein
MSVPARRAEDQAKERRHTDTDRGARGMQKYE